MDKIRPNDIAYCMSILRDLSDLYKFLKERRFSEELQEEVLEIMERVKDVRLKMSVEMLYSGWEEE